MTALLVQSDPAYLYMLASLFRAQDVPVHETRCAESASMALRQFPYALVVLGDDVLGARELCRQVSPESRVVVTLRDPAASVDTWREAGAADCVPQTLSTSELAARLTAQISETGPAPALPAACAVLDDEVLTLRREPARAYEPARLLAELARELPAVVYQVRLAGGDPERARCAFISKRIETVCGVSLAAAQAATVLPLLAQLHPEDRADHRERLAETLARGGRLVDEVRVVCARTGSVRWLELLAECRPVAGGDVVVEAMAIEIDELKQLQTELREARSRVEATTAAKSRFLLGLTHEIRTPAAVIAGLLEQLAGAPMSDADRRRWRDMRTAAGDLLRCSTTRSTCRAWRPAGYRWSRRRWTWTRWSASCSTGMDSRRGGPVSRWTGGPGRPPRARRPGMRCVCARSSAT